MLNNIDMERKQTNLILNQDLMREIKHIAIERDSTISDMVEEGLELLIEKYRSLLK